MEFMRFIFSGFWVWLGFWILIATLFSGVRMIVEACKKGREVQVTVYPGSVCSKIINIKRASKKDVEMVLNGAENISPMIEEDGNGTA